MCLKKLTPSSKGQLSIELLVLIAALIVLLGVTAGTIQELLEKATNRENLFFEQQFLSELTTHCHFLTQMGNGSVLYVNGFAPKAWTIQSTNEFIHINEKTIFCSVHESVVKQTVKGSFALRLAKNV